MFNKILDWLLVSSTDASKWSLSFKAALMFYVPQIVSLSGILCTLNVVCSGVDASGLTQLADVLSNLVYWGLSIVGGIFFVIGFVRKLWLSVTGQNKVIASWSGK